MPQGWVVSNLGALGMWTSGGTPSRSKAEYYGPGIPWVKTGELLDCTIHGTEESITEEGLRNSAARRLPLGTLLIAMYGATIGRLGILGVEAATNQACAALLPHGTTSKLIPFLFHFLRSQRDELRAMGQGGAQPNISQALLKDYPCPVAPMAEQHRIGAKIEALTAKSRRAKEALDAIPSLLDRFRQSVLAAAFRGDLTADWREKNPDVEPAEELLKRIRAERRRRWEEAELAKMRAKGKVPGDDRWKEKYEEPAPVDASELPELPEGWVWASTDDVTAPGRPIIYGIIKAGPDVPGGVPYVRVTEVASGQIDVRTLPRCDPARAALFSRATLRAGDILISKDGTIGKVAFVPPELEGGNITQHVLRLSPTPEVERRFIARMIEAPHSQRWMRGETRGIALQGVNVGDFRRMPIPLAPQAEQRAVVDAIQQALGHLDRMRGILEGAVADMSLLDRAILAKAFRGDLVPQDPNDEPASVLLERLRAEREQNRKPTNGAGRRRAAASPPPAQSEPTVPGRKPLASRRSQAPARSRG